MSSRDAGEGLSLFQRMAQRRLLRRTHRRKGEELSPEDWVVLWRLEHELSARGLKRLWHRLPASPRCRNCAAPFAGVGGRITHALGYRPSRKNPNICSTCVELSPPGGATLLVGVLFADVRNFTRDSETMSPEDVSRVLRRFYGCAERALFPEAIIDKLIGDEVMALYIQESLGDRNVPELMVTHAEALLRAVGYGTSAGPFVEVGVGLDFGEAFVGNIGDRDIYDFTAVGNVVNTASRLQGEASGGEIIVSDSVWAELDPPRGEREVLTLKGKSTGTTAHRIRYGTTTGA